MAVSSAERVRDDVVRLSARGLDVAGFFAETGRILRNAVAFDGFCSMTVDPATMLLTSHIAHDSVRPEDVPRLGRNEFLEEDVNKFAELARAPRPAALLTAATEHVPETSPRYRDILRPNGFRDELRFTLLDDGVVGAGSRSTDARRAATSRWGTPHSSRRSRSFSPRACGARSYSPPSRLTKSPVPLD